MNPLNPLWTSFFNRILQKLLFAGGAVLVTRGLFTGDEMAAYVEAAALGIISLGLSYWQTNRERLKLLLGLSSSQPMTEAEVETKLKEAKSTGKELPSTSLSKLAQPRSFMSKGFLLPLFLSLSLGGGAILNVACGAARTNSAIVMVDDTVHDNLTEANKRMQAACPAPQDTASPLAKGCQSARIVMRDTLQVGAEFNTAAQERKIDALPKLIEAIGKLQSSVTTVFDGVTRDELTALIGKALAAAFQGVKK